MKIHSAAHLNNTPCFKFVARAWADLVERDLAPVEVALSYDQRVVWAEHEQDVVGVVVWMPQDHVKTAFVQLSFVLPAYRGRGVYKQMISMFEEDAKAAGCARMAGGTAWGNREMRDIVERMGRKFIAVYYSKEFD